MRPIELCLEDLDAAGEYLQCVALPGEADGLGLSASGDPLWEAGAGVALELFATADGRLALLRRRGTGAVTVRRGGRSLEAPEGKPVILLAQDLLEAGTRRFRVHVHGFAGRVHRPTVLRLAAGIAAAAMLAACPAGSSPSPTSPSTMQASVETGTAPDAGIEVREAPPKVARDPEERLVR